jgi:hypothetical protein
LTARSASPRARPRIFATKHRALDLWIKCVLEPRIDEKRPIAAELVGRLTLRL